MNSLEKILSLNCAQLYPGHGAVVNNPTEKLTEYIEHRKLRENQVRCCIALSALNCCPRYYYKRKPKTPRKKLCCFVSDMTKEKFNQTTAYCEN